MKEREFSNIDWGLFHLVGPLKDSTVKVKPVYGWDSETYDGAVSLMGVFGEDFSDCRTIRNIDELLAFITERKFNSAHNFLFNIKYDRDAIIKLLPKENIEELKLYDRTFYKQYKIEIIGSKNFSVSKWTLRYYARDGDRLVRVERDSKGAKPKLYNHHTTFFSDIANFYQMGSLANTVEKVFGVPYEKKIDASETSGVHPDDVTPLWVEYCLEDCEHTYNLSKNLVDLTYELEFPVRRFYSPASISKAFMRKNFPDGYRFKKNELQQFGLRAYQGGRFEISRKGYFEDVRQGDIASCYPAVLDELYFPEGFYRSNQEYEPESLYSYFHCDVDVSPDFKLSPLKFEAVSENGLLVFPTGLVKDVYISKTEYETLIRHDCKVKIHKATHVFNRDPVKFVDGIRDLFARRKALGKADRRSFILKLCLNSLYGISIQLNAGKLHVVDFDPLDLADRDSDTITLEDENGEEYLVLIKTLWKAGAWFNPVIGAETTARARNRLFEEFHEYADDVVMIATDSVALTRKFPIKESKELGGWEHYPKQEGFVVGNGVYHFVDKETGEVNQGKRGLIADGGVDLRELFGEGVNNEFAKFFQGLYLDGCTLTKTRPKSLKEHLPFATSTPNDFINRWVKYPKDFDVNVDRKRKWDRDFVNMVDVRNNIIDSVPYDISHFKGG